MLSIICELLIKFVTEKNRTIIVLYVNSNKKKKSFKKYIFIHKCLISYIPQAFKGQRPQSATRFPI